MLKRFFVVNVLVLVFVACSQHSVISNLPKVVETINEKCPKMIDSETRIDAVELRGEDTLVYHFTLVNFSKENIDTAQFYKAMWPGIISNIRISPEMKGLREANAKFMYVYKDKEEKSIYSFRILPQNYR